MLNPARLTPPQGPADESELQTLHQIEVARQCDLALGFVAKKLEISKAALCRLILENATPQLEAEFGLLDEQGRPVPAYRAYQVWGLHLARPTAGS